MTLSNDELTEPERRLWQAASTGTLVKLQPDRNSLDPAQGATWTTECMVRAELLVELLTGVRTPPATPRARAVRLRGARITGTLDLEAATLICPLRLDDCSLEERVNLREAQAPMVRLSGCHVPRLDADQLETRHNLVLDLGFTARGGVTLAGAHIGGQLILDDAQLSNPDGPALDADGLRTDEGMFCRGLTARGEVRLMGACIGGILDFTRASLTRPDKDDMEDPENIWALSADRLSVDGDMRGAEFTAKGEVSLVGARIGGDLSFTKATLNNPGGYALLADGITVERVIRCGREFTARDEVGLVAARIGGWLSFTDAALDNPGGQALSADGITVERDVQCEERFTARGDVRLRSAQVGGQLTFKEASLDNGDERALQLQDLRVPVLFLGFGQPPVGWVDPVGAHVGVFVDEEDRWAAAMRLRGFTYDTLHRTEIDVKARLGWLTRDKDGYSPQLSSYEQLAAVYRRTGHEVEARQVALEKQRRRRPTLNPLGRAWNWLLYLTVGYGYRTWQAAVWLLALLLFGNWVFDRAYPASMVPAKQPVPPFHAVVYTLDVLLPIVDLGQQSAWLPRGATLGWSWVLIGAGWVLTTAVVAGLTGILKRD